MALARSQPHAQGWIKGIEGLDEEEGWMRANRVEYLSITSRCARLWFHASKTGV